MKKVRKTYDGISMKLVLRIKIKVVFSVQCSFANAGDLCRALRLKGNNLSITNHRKWRT